MRAATWAGLNTVLLSQNVAAEDLCISMCFLVWVCFLDFTDQHEIQGTLDI